MSDANTKSHWIGAGRAYQRFALQAAALDIRTAFLNQPVEVLTLRPQVANYLGIGDRPRIEWCVSDAEQRCLGRCGDRWSPSLLKRYCHYSGASTV